MIGVDIINVGRFNSIGRDDFKFWKKYFSEKEWIYCFSFPNFREHLAGIFAAKESVMKVSGTKLAGRFDLIEISHDKSGRPFALTNMMRSTKISISISHEKKYAVAVAFIN